MSATGTRPPTALITSVTPTKNRASPRRILVPNGHGLLTPRCLIVLFALARASAVRFPFLSTAGCCGIPITVKSSVLESSLRSAGSSLGRRVAPRLPCGTFCRLMLNLSIDTAYRADVSRLGGAMMSRRLDTHVCSEFERGAACSSSSGPRSRGALHWRLYPDPGWVRSDLSTSLIGGIYLS